MTTHIELQHRLEMNVFQLLCDLLKGFLFFANFAYLAPQNTERISNVPVYFV